MKAVNAGRYSRMTRPPATLPFSLARTAANASPAAKLASMDQATTVEGFRMPPCPFPDRTCFALAWAVYSNIVPRALRTT
jgi:hypothetical protein